MSLLPFANAPGSSSGSYLPLSGGTLTGTLTSQTITPSATATYTLGDSSHYYSGLWVDTVNLSSTVSVTASNLVTKGYTIAMSVALG